MTDGADVDKVQEHGLIGAFVLDGKGGAVRLDWQGLLNWNAADGPLWLHLHRQGEDAVNWIRGSSGLDTLTSGVLLASGSRPRSTAIENGLLVILRGVNLNPDAEPEDMISLRVWVEQGRIISLRREHFQTIDAIIQTLDAGVGPKTLADLFVAIVAGLTDRILPVVDEVGERLDHCEDVVANPHVESSRAELVDARREIIALHRYLSPQRQALLELSEYTGPVLEKRHRRALKEAAARLERCLADLDASRARAAVIQEEIVTQQTEAVNRRVYTLTVVAVLFMPLTLFSGMLGMNVGGIPWGTNANGFLIVSGILAVMGAAIFLILRWARWI
jgi:zinc transporter